MVQIDIPVAFGTGSLFAVAVEKGLRSERAGYFYARALATSLVFQLVLVVWLPVYLLIAHFGFQTSHMWWTGESITDYPWLVPAFLLLYFVAHVAGFHTGARLAAAGRSRAAVLIFVGSFIFFAAWVTMQPYRTLSLGTYREWEAGTAPWIWTDVGLVALLLGAMVAFFLALGWVFRVLRQEASAAAVAARR